MSSRISHLPITLIDQDWELSGEGKGLLMCDAIWLLSSKMGEKRRARLCLGWGLPVLSHGPIPQGRGAGRGRKAAAKK